MTVCFFGTYEQSFSRNAVLIKGLKENGVEIIECCSRFLGWKKFPILVFRLIKKHRQIKDKYDCIVVGFPGHYIMFLAKILSKKPVIFDVFASKYITEIERKKLGTNSLKAKFYYFADWFSCKLADKILLDTEEHIKYFVKTFKLPRNKFERIFVGTIEDVFCPRPQIYHECFTILFYAKVTPMHGFEHIINAAKILEKEKDICFEIIGKGKLYEDKIKNLDNLTNIKLIDQIAYEELPKHIQEADVCLGIFGGTQKAMLVIPNKVYESMAMGKPFITGDSRAVRELLINKESVLFCRMADSNDLADKIIELKHEEAMRKKISYGARKVFEERASSVVIGKQLKEILFLMVDKNERKN
ncbi:glycosyltransferase [Patescibacteria group bacterium]|nr:glycosyltransferase [Patescibacteria group bacterium]MBU4458376.1 glycosyltransferase [Patescibacteria group bacterium]MCG2695869.1 glycosyltransferase [Candidatus Portnoybacteria bacterium]